MSQPSSPVARPPSHPGSSRPTSSNVSLASALNGDLFISEDKIARVNGITGPQLVNPIKTKLIQGFTVDSVSAWSPVIWEIIMRIPRVTRKRAFRHSTIDPIDNYEKLEWMGDKFIGAALAQILYQNHADKHLAFQDVICSYCQKRSTMNAICRSLRMDDQIDIDRRGGLSDRVCEDVFEAVAAAIWLELGYETLLVYTEAIYRPVLAVLRRQLEESGWEEASLLSHAGRRGIAMPMSMDFLKQLKELCLERKWTYEIIDQNELDNPNPNEECWTQHIVVNGHEKASGRARNKRMARNNAAEQLLENSKLPS